jgi:membrane protease YdiL (CAAX protease family)
VIGQPTSLSLATRSLSSAAVVGSTLAFGTLLAACHAFGQTPSRLFTLLVLAPLLEEVVFRGGLQETLLRRGTGAGQANLLTAAAFSAAHSAAGAGAAVAIATLLPALAIGAVYGRQQQLRWCIALHMLMNLAWLSGAQTGLWQPFLA